MADNKEVLEKDSKVQSKVSQVIEKYNKKSYSTQSKIGQDALIQSKVFDYAIDIMGVTFENMDIEIEQKDKKWNF